MISSSHRCWLSIPDYREGMPTRSRRLRAKRCKRAFTFIEIMIVIVIFGLLLALAAPSMTTLQNRERLSTSARELVTTFRYARGQAIFSERTIEARLNIADNTYRLNFEPEIGETRNRYGRSNRKRSIDEQLRSLAQDVSFDEVFAWSDQVDVDGDIIVEFYPNGTVTPVVVILRDEKDKTKTVELARSSGKARMLDGTIEDHVLAGQSGVRKSTLVIED